MTEPTEPLALPLRIVGDDLGVDFYDANNKCLDFEQCETIVSAVNENAALRARLDRFWWELDQRYEIEPRSYFESEAGKCGDWTPEQMALHHVWKRESKVGEMAAELAAAQAQVATLREALKPLANALDGWPYEVNHSVDIGRMHYDTGIFALEVIAEREALAATELKPTKENNDE